MNSKLTAAQAARYWGCEVIHCNAIRGGMHSLTKNEMLAGYVWVAISDCQLILTPLSAITDEHAIEVAKMVYTMPSNHIAKNGRDMVLGNDWHSFKKAIEITDLLRSLGYDCDNAISEGWAVDRLAFVK